MDCSAKELVRQSEKICVFPTQSVTYCTPMWKIFMVVLA
jgi:hypothetical protein